jgi:hypothetical protein
VGAGVSWRADLDQRRAEGVDHRNSDGFAVNRDASNVGRSAIETVACLDCKDELRPLVQRGAGADALEAKAWRAYAARMPKTRWVDDTRVVFVKLDTGVSCAFDYTELASDSLEDETGTTDTGRVR